MVRWLVRMLVLLFVWPADGCFARSWLRVPFLEAKRIGILGRICAVSSACLAVASPASRPSNAKHSTEAGDDKRNSDGVLSSELKRG